MAERDGPRFKLHFFVPKMKNEEQESLSRADCWATVRVECSGCECWYRVDKYRTGTKGGHGIGTPSAIAPRKEERFLFVRSCSLTSLCE
ncbi:hypothetical protein WA026_004202 [Henosepilachna vigintioctopunctata]|uniref:Uncharacterized protein n=1 Tax=Henosepilachna vigintioctopunctata TaxID=420089 RepID=A0AAW1U9L9_9CUCU